MADIGLSAAFAGVGLDPSLAASVSASNSLAQAIDQFGSSQIGQTAAQQLKNVLKTALPPDLRVDPITQGQRFLPSSGEWQSSLYARDLVAHQPKFKFLFKVKFEGFPGSDQPNSAECFVTRCDKPKIMLNHADVNYYNFRTKVLTSVAFQPLSMTFHDEIGDTVNFLFRKYMETISGQGSGTYGIDKGADTGSSTFPYSRGSSVGRRIIIQQIFGNGLADNQFIFKNPRIETFDFDELAMEESTSGSSMTITFHYDALECITGYGKPITTWGATDIAGGGGNSNFGAGDTVSMTTTSGAGTPLGARSPITMPPVADVTGVSKLGQKVFDVASTATGAVTKTLSSAGTVISRGFQETLDSIKSGANLKYSGATERTYNPNDDRA